MRWHFLWASKQRVRDKPQSLTSDEESALWEKGQLEDFNEKVLTNVNFKNLIEQLGLPGYQIRQQEDGTEVVEFCQGSTKTRSGGLSIRRRTTPQVMYSIKSFLLIWLSNVIQFRMFPKGMFYLLLKETKKIQQRLQKR